MSKLQFRNFVHFDADFPDDSVFDSKNNPVVPGGKAIANSLVAALSQRGIHTSTVTQWEDYGWYFHVYRGRCRVWFLLQAGWLLFSKARTPLVDWLRFKSCKAEHLATLQAINECFAQDSRFSRALWYSRSEYERRDKGPGATEPGWAETIYAPRKHLTP
jgi:hypothetical protein